MRTPLGLGEMSSERFAQELDQGCQRYTEELYLQVSSYEMRDHDDLDRTLGLHRIYLRRDGASLLLICLAPHLRVKLPKELDHMREL